MFFETKHKQDCSGCTACMNVCPTTAIKMLEDEEGFFYPVINESVCINCGLCRKVCSWENPKYECDENPIVLASVLKNKTERQRSTSGGIFLGIAEWIINQGGMVFGAAFDEHLQLHHIGVDTVEGLQKLRGSKYLQSQLGTIFKVVERELKSGRWCYFTGTGCQVAGLIAYLRKEYVNLLTSDIVCHGVPNQKLFNEHISYMEKKYNDKVVSYHFRDYKYGGGCEICEFANRRPVINPSYELSPYLFSFMYGLTYRYSCYECRFAKIPRQGDITLADFWGARDYFPQMDTDNGCSLVLLNTKKGFDIWEKIKNKCDFNVSNVREAAGNNGNLIQSTSKPAIRTDVFKKMEIDGYEKIARRYFRSPYHVRLRIIYFFLQFRFIRAIYSFYKDMIRRYGR